jgi:hypothetical protein
MSSNNIQWPNTGSITAASGTVYTISPTYGANNNTYTTLTTTGSMPTWAGSTVNVTGATNPGLVVHGTMQADDVEVDGVSVKEMMLTMKVMQERLAILIPDPKKLEKFAALKESYNHYKLLEALCTDPENDKNP